MAETFHLVLQPEVYSREELALICERLADQKGISVTPPAIEMVARACDGTPHHVKLLVPRFAASGRNALGEKNVGQFLSVPGLHTNVDDARGNA